MNQPLPPRMDVKQAAARRGGVRRTVLVVVAIVVAIYAAFVLSGVFGRVPV